MPNKSLDDDLVMSAVDLALANPPEQRDAYIRAACGGDSALIDQVRKYVQLEERLGGFLEDPLFPPPPDRPPFGRGDLLAGRFDILGEVGEGGMAWVYEAWDQKLERRVAIKCAKSGFHKRLPPEVVHARDIAHDNVCRIFDIHTVEAPKGELDVISMEFLKGETLAERLQRGRIPENQALRLAQQICEGLAEAHRNGVVHGDVKSNNVIITKGPDDAERAVVTDFGLARRPGMAGARGTAQSMAGGAMDYMAPEIWKGEKASPASDVYGLGVILCELLAGRRPFKPDTSVEERFTGKPPALHRKWDRTLARCLDPDPARRFQNAGGVAEALKPRIKVWRWYVVAAAAVLLAVISTGEIYRYFSKDPMTLALDPVAPASADLAALADKLTHDIADQLVNVKGGPTSRFTFVGPEKGRAARNASDFLQIAISRENGKLRVHAALTEARSGSRLEDWSPIYAPGEERYIPVALAGMVTANFNLQPLTTPSGVNAAARQDYWSAIWYLRRASGFEQALVYLDRAVGADPDSALVYAALAEARWRKYYSTKDQAWFTSASEAEREAELRNPDLAPVHCIKGQLLKNQGEYEMAEAEYGRAIFLNPGDSEAHIRLGQAYEARNQIEPALEEYRRSMAAEPDYYRPYQELGAFYYNRAKFAEAVAPYEKAVNLAPDEPELREGLAAIYIDEGRFAEAEAQLKQSVGMKVTERAVFQLGLTQMYQGNNEAAIRSLKQAMSLYEPGRAPKYLPLMYLGIAYRLSNLPQLAQQVNQQGLTLAIADATNDPRDGYKQAFVAYFDAALGNSRAKSEIDAAVHLAREDAETRWTAVLTYEALHLRAATLDLLSSSSAEQIADVNRWPDLSDLHMDHRFQDLLVSHQVR